ncbi:MAG: hypothetical protein K0S44_869 [Bacteroidetes bacterium]|jgi:hypothetical protein|nr:hypothetical protein [Bacteroidota bacterium]
MKQWKRTLLKGLLVIILFTGGTLVLSTSGIKTVSEAKAATYNQVNEYLIANGYTVISLEPKDGERYDWLALTSKDGREFITTIYCTSSSIIGHADVPM